MYDCTLASSYPSLQLFKDSYSIAGANSLTVGGGSVGTYNYKVNSNNIAVVSYVSITITNKDIDHGTDTTSCTQSYSRLLDDDGIQNCDAGHILANRLGNW